MIIIVDSTNVLLLAPKLEFQFVKRKRSLSLFVFLFFVAGYMVGLLSEFCVISVGAESPALL